MTKKRKIPEGKINKKPRFIGGLEDLPVLRKAQIGKAKISELAMITYKPLPGQRPSQVYIGGVIGIYHGDHPASLPISFLLGPRIYIATHIIKTRGAIVYDPPITRIPIDSIESYIVLGNRGKRSLRLKNQ